MGFGGLIYYIFIIINISLRSEMLLLVLISSCHMVPKKGARPEIIPKDSFLKSQSPFWGEALFVTNGNQKTNLLGDLNPNSIHVIYAPLSKPPLSLNTLPRRESKNGAFAPTGQRIEPRKSLAGNIWSVHACTRALKWSCTRKIISSICTCTCSIIWQWK